MLDDERVAWAHALAQVAFVGIEDSFAAAAALERDGTLVVAEEVVYAVVEVEVEQLVEAEKLVRRQSQVQMCQQDPSGVGLERWRRKAVELA